MRLGQFLVLVVVTFVACSVSIAAATDEALITHVTIHSNNEPVHGSHRYLKGSKETNKVMTAEDEERVVSFKQYLGVFRLPSNFASLPGIKQLSWLGKKFGKQAGKVLNALQRFRLARNHNAQI
ncbi:Avirulence protein (Avh) [Phytophthora palmivora]|uniref:RxLR effector protein n=1 Tax=Phytophthora palmivora TaxID=4796 RepID=A0A2P4Y7Y3_9STRA|nr:Avirulence protein (Avh) [Phytophthora palmivora]